MNIVSILNSKISNLVAGLLNHNKKIDIATLPSQGIFYEDDFEIKIKKASVDDIIEYEFNFKKDDIGSIIQKVKKVVQNNTILSKNYDFEDIKSIDVIFIFLEIVKFTKKLPIIINYYDEELEGEFSIEFDKKTFNYFFISSEMMKYYDKENKCFFIYGYKFSLPTIGVENCLTNYLIYKSSDKNAEKFQKYSYDFNYFLSQKKYLSFQEIENLIQIFNYELEKEEKLKIKDILDKFLPLQKYSLIKNGKVIDINSKLDLDNIWK
jgi:hypothetical protein